MDKISNDLVSINDTVIVNGIEGVVKNIQDYKSNWIPNAKEYTVKTKYGVRTYPDFYYKIIKKINV